LNADIEEGATMGDCDRCGTCAHDRYHHFRGVCQCGCDEFVMSRGQAVALDEGGRDAVLAAKYAARVWMVGLKDFVTSDLPGEAPMWRKSFDDAILARDWDTCEQLLDERGAGAA
jgi:predicted  nucleic acid-binding Zn-ribbon protein